MNKKLLYILLGIAGALLLISIIVAIIATFKNPAPDDTSITDTTNATPDATSSAGDTTTTTTSSDTTSENNGGASTSVSSDDQGRITSLAKSFAERYGSHSTDTNFENVEDLRSFMTEDMQKSADAFIVQGYTNVPAGQFYGITTEAFNISIVDFSEGSTGATVEVDTRRTETKGIEDPVIFSQTARLQLKKVSDAWKIDRFQWL